MFIIFAQHITPRLTYIAKTILGSETVVTLDVLKFSNSSLQKINYSSTHFNKESLWIKPYGLLEQTTIEPQQIDCDNWNNLPIFFKTEGSIPFDIFSASFYLITRYEEYFDDYKKDNYSNYHHENSVAIKHNFLHLPLINLWLKQLENNSKLNIQLSKFTIIPSYDVDIAFAYKHHSLIKNMGGFIKDILKQRGIFKERLSVLLNYKKDPYDVFNWLNNLHQEQKLNAIYFFLVAQNRSVYDKNALPKSKGMIELIKQISKQNVIGIHPSFVSNNDENILQNEIALLTKISNKKINISRQHYLQLSLPKTYETLLQQGIYEDYTMGYGTHNGFRASYTKPFYWYNLKEEKETSLLLHPFCYMDSNSIFEQQLTPEKALEEMLHYYNIVKQINGDFIFVMHNHFLAKNTQWNSWRNVYKQFLNKIATT